MIYDLVNSTSLQFFFIVLSVVWFICIFFYFYYKINEWKLKRRGERQSEQIRHYKNIASWLFFCNVVFAIFIVPFCWKRWSTNSLRGKYAWSISEKSRETIGVFLDVESEEKFAESETDRGLHKEWIKEQYKEGKIDQHRIDKYQWETRRYFFMNTDEYIMPQEEIQDISSEVQENKRIFGEAVSKKKSELTLEKCRNGYKAGKNLLRYYCTSENVFQIAVLAENAYDFSSRNGTETERQKDLMVAVKYFENFTHFNKKDSGNGIIKSEYDVAFRIGELLYKEARILGETNLIENRQIISHLLLYAFECFKYAVEGLKENDDYYVLYLYYEGSVAYDLVGYIEEKAVVKKLCSELYDQFDAVSKETIDSLPSKNFENMDKDEFQKIKELLKDLTQ